MGTTVTRADETAAKRLAEVLRSSVNRDGGWGYSPAKASRLEPTCWAALALLDSRLAADDAPRVDAAVNLIAGWQRPGGLLAESASLPPNLAFNGLAALTLHRMLTARPDNADRLHRGMDLLLGAILGSEGVRFGRSRIQRQDNQLAAWPWNDGAFSWVEPTAWCLLAIKKAGQRPSRPGAADRIAAAERMLADRCCVSGGWNYGNSNVLGQELFPYVPTTAVALLALQDRPALPEVVRSLEWLAGNWHRERSALAASLTLLAMRAHRVSFADVERDLHSQLADSGPPANLVSAGLMLYALTGSRHEHAAFVL